MAVRSKRLAVASGGAADYTLVTCPADETVLVKRCTVVNSGSTAVYYWWLQPGGSGTKYYVHVESGVVINSSRDFDTWYVLQPTDKFGCLTTVSSSSYLTVHGAELEGVAD